MEMGRQIGQREMPGIAGGGQRHEFPRENVLLVPRGTGAGRESNKGVGGAENEGKIHGGGEDVGQRADRNFRKAHFQPLGNAFVINPRIPNVAVVHGVRYGDGDRIVEHTIGVDGDVVAIDVTGKAHLSAVVPGIKFHREAVINTFVADAAAAKSIHVTGGLNKKGNPVTALNPVGVHHATGFAEAEAEESAEATVGGERDGHGGKGGSGLATRRGRQL